MGRQRAVLPYRECRWQSVADAGQEHAYSHEPLPAKRTQWQVAESIISTVALDAIPVAETEYRKNTMQPFR